MSPSRGIWITTEILQDESLSHLDKLILGHVAGFAETGCFASNSAIGELLAVRPQTIQNRISYLVAKGRIKKIGSHHYRKLLLGENMPK